MRESLRFASALALCLVLGAGVAMASAVETARIQNPAPGAATVLRDGAVTPVTASTEFKTGDQITVEAGAKMTVSFEDGSSITLVGPSSMTFGEMSSQGRRVRLDSGVITEATALGIALEVQTPYADSLVLQNGSAFARVVPGDKVTFQRLSGDFVKVYTPGLGYQDLGSVYTVNVRDAGDPPGDPPADADEPRGDVEVLNLGGREVTIAPASEFSTETLPGGGVRITYTGDDFGSVEVGGETVLFLGADEYVELSPTGEVTVFTGVSHIYHPPNLNSFYDDPISDVTDLSLTRVRRR